MNKRKGLPYWLKNDIEKRIERSIMHVRKELDELQDDYLNVQTQSVRNIIKMAIYNKQRRLQKLEESLRNIRMKKTVSR